MANVRGGLIGERTRPRSYVVEEFVPLSTCAEVSDCHYLIFSLPGFKKEDVRIQVQDSGYVTISGERRVNEKKYMYFEKNFKVPENCAVHKSVRELEGHDVFYVIFPKKRSKDGEKKKRGLWESKGEIKEEKREKVGVCFWQESVRKGLILTALVAISVLVLVTYRFKSPQFN